MRELRGDTDGAVRLMQRALDDAPTPADRSFALIHLGELAYNQGDPVRAFDYYEAALAAQPDSAATLAGRARARAATGDTDGALRDYEELTRPGGEPFHILRYAEFLVSIGRTDAAAAAYALYEEQEARHAANELLPDGTWTLLLANHGQPARALTQAQRAVDIAPFVDTLDAYAWAIHRNGRHADAWAAMERAFALDTPNALHHYHAGMIRLALGEEPGAREHLETALDINPYFNLVAAGEARATLDELVD